MAYIKIDITNMTNRKKKRIWYNLRHIGKVKKIEENGKKFYVVVYRPS